MVTGAFIASSVIVVLGASGGAAAIGGSTRQIPSGGTTSIRSGPVGSDGLQQPELRPGTGEGAEGGNVANRPRPGSKGGAFPSKPLDAPKVASAVVAGSNPELGLSISGLNHRDQ